MKLAKGAWSHILVGEVVGVAGILIFLMHHRITGAVVALLGGVITAFMVYFFRDPERPVTVGDDVLLCGADGWVRQVDSLPESKFLNCDCVRICTFLTPFDVHVNRTPLAGTVTKLDYTPGRHVLTIQQAASEVNEHSSIVIEGQGTRCLVRQIVGPLVRRVVYWLEEGQKLAKADRIGIMKFGSRLDVYFPSGDVEVLVKKGDRVFAGITPLARIVRKEGRV
jgi:phosphatidylserine decarboxylase